MEIVKRDGSIKPFETQKVRKWVGWAVQGLSDRIEMEYYILKELMRRLPEKVSTEEIHQTMIQVCLDKEDVAYTVPASMLEKASIYKNLEANGFLNPQSADFSDLIDFFTAKGIWSGSWVEELSCEDIDELNELYVELEAVTSKYPTIKQWQDKYSKKLKGLPIETPAMGAVAIAVAIHGPTKLAHDVARDIIYCRLNLPTPVLNGMRNGNSDSVSCCVIAAGDSIESIDVAELLASGYTAKKSGIGMMLNTRSKGDPVKNGAVTHLGKAPLYKAIEASVKKYTQETRGGSCNMNFRCIDPEVLSILLWKTQRIDLAQRIDRQDYTFVYNDSFVEAVLNNEDWYLFSEYDAPEVHKNFHRKNYLSYVRAALLRGAVHKKEKALNILTEFLKSRVETGRVYCLNATRVNEHTPFLETIIQTNLCAEICLPTKPFYNLEDLWSDNSGSGEVAFCVLAAINVAETSTEEYPEVAYRALKTTDKMLDLAKGLYPQTELTMKQRRSIGVGITGLASYLYKLGLDYDGSYESLKTVEQLAALHYWCLLSSSQKMSAETGFEVNKINLDWLPMDTAMLQTDPDDWDIELDWESLRGKPRMHSVLSAMMPTESSALMSGSTNGLYPSRDRVIYKKARTGRVQFISEHFDSSKLTCWNIDSMHKYYGAVQNFTDQGISCDYYIDFTQYPGMKVPITDLIKWFIKQWAAGNKSCYYHVFKDVESKQDTDCESCKL